MEVRESADEIAEERKIKNKECSIEFFVWDRATSNVSEKVEMKRFYDKDILLLMTKYKL